MSVQLQRTTSRVKSASTTSGSRADSTSAPATRLLVPDQPEFNHSSWYTPAGINEGPWVHYHGGRYYLMYGAGANTCRIGYATSIRKVHGQPDHQAVDPTTVGVYGPGHHRCARGFQRPLATFYHQQRSTSTGWHRFVCVDELEISMRAS